jgi:hypothetical protein
MAKRRDRVTRLSAATNDFIDLIQSIEALKAVHPERSRSPEVTAAIAELESLVESVAVRMNGIRRVDVRN